MLRKAALPLSIVGGGGLALGLVLVLALALAPSLPLLEGLSFSPLVLDRQGQLLRMGLTADEKFRARVSLPEIAPQAVQATLLYEDQYFYKHPGVNPLALLRAVFAMAWGERRMGGSTITMQVARLRYGLQTTTLGGKLRQMWLALCLEWQYSKREILEAYFCLAPYGGNVEGIGAAARIYFGRTPAQLTLVECLALAPVPQNPVRRWPLASSSSAFTEARARMHKLWAKVYPQEGALFGEGARPAPLRILGPASLPFEAPHVSAALLTEVAQQVENPLDTRDVTFHTTLSLPLQKMLEQRLAAFAARGRIYGLNNAAALLLHWPSMEMRALVGSAHFADARIAGQVDGTLARRSPGSTLKPFIYALALDQGLIHPQTLLVDSPRSFGGYNPENFDRSFRGPLPAHAALRASRNIPAIGLASRLDPDLYTFLKRAGVHLPFSLEHYGLSLVLGGAEVSMRQLAELYAVLPNKGIWRPARLLDQGGRGGKGGRGASAMEARSLLSPEAAVLTLHMLEEPGRELRTRRGALPHRYKTGTSNRFRDAWTVGIVGPYVLAVWAGNFDNSPNPLLVGGDVAAPLYEDIAEGLGLHEALADVVPTPAEAPSHDLNLLRIPVCTDTGDLDVSLCPKTTETWYIPGVSPTRSSNVYRTILVDRRTGLRACQPSAHTREEVREFWPTDLQVLFARAGLVKPAPPPYGPECAGLVGEDGTPQSAREETKQALSQPQAQDTEQSWRTGVDGAGSAPRILSPRDGVIYQRRVGDEHSGRNAIPLLAGVDADAGAVFWFVNDRFVGRRDVIKGAEATEGTEGTGGAGHVLLWQPEGGTHVLRVVDNLGRASTRRVRVETLP